jgi:hypothetical protein
VRYSIVSEVAFVYREKMDKKEFRVLMKHCFLVKKKILLKPSLGLINIIRTVLGKSTIEIRFAKFKREDARSGRPNEARQQRLVNI